MGADFALFAIFVLERRGRARPRLKLLLGLALRAALAISSCESSKLALLIEALEWYAARHGPVLPLARSFCGVRKGGDEAGEELDEEWLEGWYAGAYYSDVDFETRPDGDVYSFNYIGGQQRGACAASDGAEN